MKKTKNKKVHEVQIDTTGPQLAPREMLQNAQWGQWRDAFECVNRIPSDLKALKVKTQTGHIEMLVCYLPSKGYTSDTLNSTTINLQDIYAVASDKIIPESVICPDALKIYQHFHNQINPQHLKDVHSEWLKLFNKALEEKLFSSPQLQTYLTKPQKDFNFNKNPIEAICDKLEASNGKSKSTNTRQKKSEEKLPLEQLLKTALKTTCLIEPDIKNITNSRYKKIIENSNELKKLINNTVSLEEIQHHLKEHDVAINIASKDGYTILHNVCYGINPAILKELIAHGSDVNIQNNFGATVVHNMISSGFSLENRVKIFECCKILLQSFDKNLQTYTGQTLQHYYCYMHVSDVSTDDLAMRSKNLDIISNDIKALSQNGCNTYLNKDIDGFTLMDLCYRKNKLIGDTCAKSFEDVGYNYFADTKNDCQDSRGNFNIHRLSLTGETNLLMQLASQNPSVLNAHNSSVLNAQNYKEQTPLHIAIDLIEELTQKIDEDRETHNAESHTYDSAEEWNDQQIAKNMITVIILICSGTNLFLKDNAGKTPLERLNQLPERTLKILLNTNAPIKTKLKKAITESGAPEQYEHLKDLVFRECHAATKYIDAVWNKVTPELNLSMLDLIDLTPLGGIRRMICKTEPIIAKELMKFMRKVVNKDKLKSIGIYFDEDFTIKLKNFCITLVLAQKSKDLIEYLCTHQKPIASMRKTLKSYDQHNTNDDSFKALKGLIVSSDIEIDEYNDCIEVLKGYNIAEYAPMLEDVEYYNEKDDHPKWIQIFEYTRLRPLSFKNDIPFMDPQISNDIAIQVDNHGAIEVDADYLMHVDQDGAMAAAVKDAPDVPMMGEQPNDFYS